MVAPLVMVMGSLLVQEGEAPPRTAEEIVREFEANPSPGFGMGEEFEALLRERLAKQCECAWELYRGYPRHPRLKELLFARWMNLLNFHEEPAQARAESEKVLAGNPAEGVRALARFVRAQASLRDESVAVERARRAVEEFLAEKASFDERHGWRTVLLQELAQSRVADPAEQAPLLRRAIALDEGEEVVLDAKRALAAVERVGEPLELAFDDALGNGRFDLAGERGHPVLVHVAWFVYGDPAKQFRALAAALPKLAQAGVTVASTSAAPAEGSVREVAKTAGVTWWLEIREDDPRRSTSPLGLDPPAFVVVDCDGKVAGVYSRIAPALERVAGGPPKRPKRRSF
jgi:hypothetical protein